MLYYISMKIDPHFNLKNFSALKLGPETITAISIETRSDLPELTKFLSKKNLLPCFVGRSTNTIFTENISDQYAIIFSELKNFSQQNNLWTFESGLSWDFAVRTTVEHNFSGLESLSIIPGTTGAAPVQNIGAYGSEFADHCHSVEVFDLVEQKILTLTKADCQFSYRHSFFKQNPNRYFILSVTLELSPNINPTIPPYKDVQAFFASQNITQATANQIREAIISIRSSKLPDSRLVPNLGSYFQNPILSAESAQTILTAHPEIPHSTNTVTGEIKFFAGWLIEQAGLKGVFQNHFGTHPNNALVLIGDGQGSFADLQTMEQHIISTVQDKFSLHLTREPNLIK